jgi:hypothetical protein
LSLFCYRSFFLTQFKLFKAEAAWFVEHASPPMEKETESIEIVDREGNGENAIY